MLDHRVKILVSLIVLLLGCGKPSNSRLDNASISGLSAAADLGAGYDNRLQEFTGARCLSFSEDLRIDTVTSSNRGFQKITHGLTTKLESGAVLYRDLDFNKASNLISAGLEVEIPIIPSLVTLIGSADFAKESASTDYSETYVFAYNIVRGTQRFEPTDYGLDQEFYEQLKGISDRDSPNAPPDLSVACGQEYLAQIDFGADFFVNMRIEFRNQFEKQMFGGAVAAALGVPGFNIPVGSVGFKLETEEEKESLKISISVLQRGGDPDEIFKAIPFSKYGEDEDKIARGVNVVNCNFNNMQPCKNIFADLMQYGYENFPKQLKNAKAFVPVRYHTYPYAIPELMLTRRMSDSELAASRQKIKQIQRALDGAQMGLKRVNSLMGFPQRYYRNIVTANVDREMFQQLAVVLENNILVYSEALRFCLENPGNDCIDTVDKEFLKEIEPYDASKLNATVTTFDQWCLMYFNDVQNDNESKRTLKKEIFLTMHSLMLGLEKNGKRVSNCSDAMDILDGVTEISLAKGDVTDLSPLRELTNLRKIDLSNNRKLVDLKPIQNLPGLVDLNLSFTGVTELGLFFENGWEDLKYLNMSYNRISDMFNRNHDFWKRRNLILTNN